MVRLEWKNLLKNKILLLVVVAIIAIPTIYTTLFLGSMWDPYGKVDQMPVAVVNLDQPVTYEGKELKVGEELVDNLKDNDSLSFNFVNAEDAEAGIRDGKYYMVITIPEDFSANASTLMDEHPKKMQLTYETNPGTNYIAMKMSESAMQKIKSSVAEEVTKTYAETVFEQLIDIGDGMQEAADGAGEVQNGVKKLSDGNEEITDNLKLLADSTLTFKEGSEELTVGLGDYTQGVVELQSGAKTLSEGTGTLKAGAGELAAGVATLNSGALQLKNGTEAFTEGTKTLAGGAMVYVEGTTVLANGAKTYADGTKTLAAGVKNYVENSEKLKAGMDQLAGLEQLGQVSQGVAQLNTAVNTGSDTTPALKDATSSLAAGLQIIYMQVSDLKDTATGEQLSKLAGQLGAAVQGISDAADGISDAADTVGQAAGGVDTAAQVIDQTVSALNNQIDANNAKINDAENTINNQIASANAEISAQGIEAKSTINCQIDSAIKAVEIAKEAGGLSDDEASSIIGELQSAKVDEAVSGRISEVDASDVKMQSVSAGSAVQSLQQVSAGLGRAEDGLNDGAKLLKGAAGSLQNGLAGIPTDINSDVITQLAAGLKTAADGAAAINNGVNGEKGLANALNQLESATSSFPQAAAGVTAVRAGMAELTSYDSALVAGADQLLDNADTLKGGADQLLDNAGALTNGADQLLANADSVTDGAAQVAGGVQTLADAAGPLVDGVEALDDGAEQIYDGTSQLAANNSKLLSGSAALTDGAVQISDGAGKLADGSVELGDGLQELGDGSDELKTALADGADEISEIDATDEMMGMFSAPVDAEEVFITEIANNGHAMSAYMMSVALWVGCIAFCIMYPLMKYEGPIRSGFDWWLSKASVLFVMAIGMALVMLGMLHICNGFAPADWGQMILVACLASVAFMSIMYFFNVLLGKVGSFLMLIFMVVQLAGAAGTYPIELSGDFVATIHPWLPFSYTVDAFRAALAGAGNIHHAVMVLIAIIVVFTLLTINLFRIRTKENRHGRKNFYELLEERGLA